MKALRILAVEDNPADFRLLKEYLGESPSSRFEIVKAETLKEALELLSAGEFDTVMLDLNLPDSFGLEGLEKLVKARPTVPYVVLTGADKPEIGLLSLSKGAQDYLVKGKIDSDALVRSIRYAIERNKAEEAVRQMNAELAIVSERLAFAQQSAGAGTWDWDMLSGKMDWSPELFRLFGLDPAAPASFALWNSVILPEDRKIASDRIEQAIQNHTRLVNEYRILLSTGTVCWINALGDTTYGADGKPTRMSGICLDITDRKHVDEALRQTLKEIEVYYDTAPVGLCVLDADLRFTKINERMAEITGIPAAQHLWLSAREIMPHLAEKIDPVCHRVIESGAPWLNLEITEEHPAPSGIRRTWLSHFYPLKDLKERVIGINVVMEEITERKRAEEALRESEERYRTLTRVAPDAVFLNDSNGSLLDVNVQACRNLGYSREQLLRMSVSDIEGDFDAAAVQKVFTAMEPGSVQTMESRHRRQDGSLMQVEIRVTCFELQGQRLFMALARDISERKRVEEALKNAHDKLEERVKERTAELSEVNKKLRRYQDDLRSLTSELLLVEERERKQLAATLHDSVGQLMALMQIKLGALGEQLSSKADRTLLEEARKMADQNIRLVRNLTVELSPPVLYQLGLPAALEELGDRLMTDFGIRMSVDDLGCPRHLDEALRTFLFQSLRELIMNIGKHSKAKTARLTLTPRDQALDVGLEDDGVGFDPNKAINSRSFGLFSVRERMFHIGGTMQIESGPGRGTRIMLSVPLPAPAKKE